MPAPSSSVSFSFRNRNARRSWLPYFLAAIGAGAAVADEELMRYYWVMQEAAPEKSHRVIRVQGEKGERYEEVYADETLAALKQHPAILEAKLARQASLRKDAHALAKQLRESGKEPQVAYEEAWTEVFSKNRLNAGGLNESCRLEDMLTRLASENEALNLTEEEQQWLLEALLEDDDRLESEAGLELLRRLAAQLRRVGYGNPDKSRGVNDELMQHFAEAMRNLPDSMNAFRDALFKTNRGSIVTHSLIGYRAPWGIRVDGGLHYHQAPLQVDTTEGSANTQLPEEASHIVGSGQQFTDSTIVEIPGATDDFLATAPELTEKEEEDEEDEDDTLTQEESESDQVAAAPAMMMRSFSMRSSAPATFAATQDDGDTSLAGAVSGNPDTLHWASVAGEPALWDTEQTTCWIDVSGSEVRYTTGASVEFGDIEGLNKSVQITDGGVVADSVAITGSDYSFSGGNLVVTNRLSVTDSAAFGVTLDVGANRIQGGSLENVQMLITGDIHRPLTDDTVTVHNLITSADGENTAVLSDVVLYAGTSTEYVTLHNVVFAGNSTLTGYITFEKVQHQHEMGVAADSTLTLKDVTFDLRGLGFGEKVLIDNEGTIVDWDKVHFVYSGVTVNSKAAKFNKEDDVVTPGVVYLDDQHDGNLYWRNGAADYMWNTSSANWLSSADSTEPEAFTALSNVYFDSGAAGNRDISITQDMVVMQLGVTDGGYSFSGARVAVLGDAYLNPGTGKVTFHDQLVIQGNLTAEGNGSVELLDTTTVAGNATFNNLSTYITGDMTVGGSFIVNAGGEGSAGSLTISGNVTAAEMDIAVGDGGNNGNGLVNVTGNLSVDEETGSITIGGTAEQHYLGVMTAGKLTVNTKEHDVYFDHLHVKSLTVAQGAHVHVQTSSAASSLSTSTFPIIYLSGTLALDAHGATYNKGYDVYVQDDAASLVFGTDCTIDNLNIIGQQDASDYTNVDIEVQSRSATVTGMKNLGDLKVETGTLTVKNAEGAVHGQLILDKGKLKLGEKSDNIMATDSGAILLYNGSRLDIGTTTQTLYANNDIFLSGASTITGSADGGGLLLGASLTVNYTGTGNSIDARLTVAQGHTITLTASDKDVCSLEIDGLISGSGEMKLTGKGTVVLYGANPDFTGKVTVDGGSTLTLLNTDSLSNASVILGTGGTLALNAPGAVTLNSLTLQDGSTLAISSIVDTDEVSKQDAAIQVNKALLDSKPLTLNIHFADELQTMTNYNIMTGLTSIVGLSLEVTHNGVSLAASQYNLGFKNGVLYIHTMMGNVWNGGGDKIWSTKGGFANWSEGKYNEDKKLGYTAAVFRDLSLTDEEIKVQGTVNPGDIYFTADATKYTLASDETNGGSLAAGTHIHKLGEADVTLSLAGNTTKDTALGNVEVQAGSLILSNNLAVKGSVTVEKDANLKLKDGSGGLTMFAKEGDSLGCYTVSYIAPPASTESDTDTKLEAYASFSGVTMDAAGIRGMGKNASSADKLLVQGTAHLSNLTLSNFETNRYDDDTKGIVTLSDVTLDSTGKLRDVVIGAGVDVAASGSYTLSGDITFDSTLTNKGIITLDKVNSIEIGKLQHTPTFDAESGRVQYDYQLIKSEGNGSVTEHTHTSSQFTINGVSLDGGLIVDVLIDGSRHGALSLTVDKGNVAIPQWDEDWGKTEKAPAFTRIYAGTDEDTVELAAGIKDHSDYYRYSSIVEETNANRVNGGKAIAVTLTPYASGELVVGGQSKWGGSVAAGHEVWIYDRSEFRNIIGGLGSWAENQQSTATHILVNSTFAKDPDAYVRSNPEVKINDRTLWAKQFIIAGSRWTAQGSLWGNAASNWQPLVAESYVTVLNGEIYTIFGGSCAGSYLQEEWDFVANADQYGTSHVFVDGGRIGEIFAAGMYSTLTGTQVVDGRENKRAVELVITGGTLGGHHLRVFGGGERCDVYGDIYIRMEGEAYIASQLVGGSNAGAVYGDIEMDLISGTAFRVDAAGIGWTETKYDENGNPLLDKDGNPLLDYHPAKINGNVRVNLYRAEAGISNSTSTDDNVFRLGSVTDIDPASRLIGGIYGGMETTNLVEIATGSASTLHFAESARYELASIVENGYNTSANSVVVTGFDRFELENGTHVVLGLGLFDIDMDPAKELVISGEGVVEVIGHGITFEEPLENYDGIVYDTKIRDEYNLGRDIKLENSATLKISTSVIGSTGSEDDRTITVTDGTTIDFSGVPGETGYKGVSDFAGLGFNVVIAGYGVDGKGAIYKGKNDDSWYPDAETFSSTSQRIILPNVKLTDSASVKVVAGEALLMNNASEQEGGTYAQGTAHLTLNGHTFTKIGAGDFIARSVEITHGTILVQQGGFGFDLTDDASQTDMVLAAGAKLKLNATEDWKKDDTDAPETSVTTANLTLRSLSGAGTVHLNGSTLTLHTGDPENGPACYQNEYMVDAIDKPQAYDQFSKSTGFGYAVFSGLIKDGGKLVKTGSGVHYISGSSNTYTGGTQLQEGRLYLLGTSEKSELINGEFKVASGVAGTGTIVWDSSATELYLGHGTRIYNNGTTTGTMTIGVEGASGVLANFVGVHGTVMMRGVEYVEIDTHNLKFIAEAGLYADGTEYVAGTEINHNKKLLLKKSDRGVLEDVVGILGTGTKDEVKYVEIDTHNLKSLNVDALYEVNIPYEAETDIEHDKKLLVKVSDQWKLGDDVSILGTVTKGEETYVVIDTHNLKTIAVDGLYEVNTLYKAGTAIEHDKKLLVAESDRGKLEELVSIQRTVAVGGVNYVEIDTHNLKAIAVDGLYADGTAYVAGTDIDRNKMLLVEESVWDTAKNTSVTSLSDTGYNEAVYSGVLSGVGAKLHKVGVGTLVLDQQNTYTGGTEIDAGTLRVRGWGTLGKNVKENTAIVHKGATLMFTHNSGYGNEPTEAANDIRIEGSGDALWANHAATDKGTAALISAVGPAVTFTLSGDISGSGNVRHSGEGKLVLSGDSSYEGGTYVSRGTLEVQSAKGLGATASGKGSVTVEHDADLRVTVESDYKDARMVTTLAADTNDIQGDVYVQGTADTERILNMDGNGYNAVSTTLDANGTLLINGAAINGTAVKAESELLTGSGNVVVSDASASGTSASFDSMKDYTGDFRVEGDKTSIRVGAGSHEEGSIYVAGQQSSVHIGGHVYIAAGESLHLRSTGAAGTDAGTSALLASGGVVGVASGAVFSVSNAETEFAYNLSELKDSSSVTLGDLISPAGDVSGKCHPVGADVGTYTGRFDASIAVNKQAVGAVQAAGGLTLAGGATYETLNAHTSLLGGSLTLYVLENNQITLNTDFELDFEADEVQLVLFSDVGSVNFALDGVIAKAGEEEGEGGVYYTRADRYLTGSDYVNSQTMLVYDSEAGVVYLQTTRPVPEPATTALSLLAVSGLLARRRRRD